MTLPPEYFEELYERRADPWGFRTRWYEDRKRRLTLAALPESHYGSVFEPGCSIGVLTLDLAARADRILAMDVSDRALETAARNMAGNVELRRGSVPDDWPGGQFDLVVLSEIGYYLDSDDLQRLADLAMTSADELIAIHWRHPVEDYPLTGDDVHRTLRRSAERHRMSSVVDHVEADLAIEVWSRDGRSVAARSGLR